MAVLLVPPKYVSEIMLKPRPPTRVATPYGGTEMLKRMAKPGRPPGAGAKLRSTCRPSGKRVSKPRLPAAFVRFARSQSSGPCGSGSAGTSAPCAVE